MIKILKILLEDVKKYFEYIKYSVKIELKRQVAGTIFGYFWWFLDPLFHMLVYTILVGFIYKNKQVGFPLFMFCALLPWKWTTSSIASSVTCISRKSAIIKQIYIPKFILPLIESTTNFIKYIFGIGILIIMMGIYRINPTIHLLEIVPIIVVNYMIIYGVSLLVSHFGTLYIDFKNFIDHILRLWFYLSPGLYSITRIPKEYRWIWRLNPMTSIFESYRNVIIYGKSPMYKDLGIWAILSFTIILFGLFKVYKFDKNYAKVV